MYGSADFSAINDNHHQPSIIHLVSASVRLPDSDPLASAIRSKSSASAAAIIRCIQDTNGAVARSVTSRDYKASASHLAIIVSVVDPDITAMTMTASS